METKLESGDLVKALIEVQAAIGPTMMESAGYNYKYLGLPEILKVSKPILSKHNILLQQFVDINGEEHRVTVNTLLMSVSGESMRCGGTLGPTPMKGSNETQQLGASCAYLRRFQAMTILGLIGADDDDEKDFVEKPPKEPPEQYRTAEQVNKNGPTTKDQKQQIINGIRDLALDPVFNDADRIVIKTSYMNARTLPALQKVLADTHSAFTDKGGSTE